MASRIFSLAVAALMVAGCAVASDPSASIDPGAAASATRTAQPSPEATQVATPSLSPVVGQEPTGPTQIATVLRIIDGDTIEVSIDGEVYRVRYIGIDTPEVHSGVEWMGQEASAANESLVGGREVVLEKDVSETDQYGRLLRYVWLAEESGWLLVNLELLRLGFAQVTTYPPDVKYVDALYVDAESGAIAHELGLWGLPPTPAPTVAPQQSNCEPSYPDICIPIGAADLDCPDMYAQNISRIRVLWDVANPDPHRFDGNGDGVGCEG